MSNIINFSNKSNRQIEYFHILFIRRLVLMATRIKLVQILYPIVFFFFKFLFEYFSASCDKHLIFNRLYLMKLTIWSIDA